MQKKWFSLVGVVVIVVALAFFFWQEGRIPVLQSNTIMQVDSSVIHDGGVLTAPYTCDGTGLRPPLVFHDVPTDAVSLAVVVTDTDAPAGTFTHWLLWNMATNTPSIRSDELPMGAIEGANSTGTVGWFAPCPPQGDTPHHYVFTMYALDVMLSLPTGANVEDFARAANGHVVATGSMTATYQR